MSYKEHKVCRVCGSDKLTKYIDLGMLPLSNNLCETQTEEAPTYPLQVMLCEKCSLSQLSIVVDQELLFGNYVYRSSISAGYVDHCRQMAKELKQLYKLTSRSFRIDIAGNDGCLLREFKDEIGLGILNIDPAKNLITLCQSRGIPSLSFFWSLANAKMIEHEFGKADLITATNVFAHVDNVNDFMQGVKYLLKPETGVLVLEFPYLIDFIEKNEFDTIYFEHLSYFSIYPLVYLCAQVGLNVMKVEKQNIHGGTVRVHIGFQDGDESVNEYLDRELDYKNIAPYTVFSNNANAIIKDFKHSIDNLKFYEAKIAAFAASAKGNTLLNCAGITTKQIDYIVDQTPEKLGKYSPGTHIPILPMAALIVNQPDYLVILSWNFASEIIDKCKKSGYKGKFIVPISEFKIID
jgi:ubiquinone/menaquinone biosynthesis C-methylase UbiE